MNLSLYSAATGMEAQQLNLNTIANNLANVNTPGFKRSKIEFQDLLYQKPTRASGTDSGGGNLVPTGVEVGNGSRVAATSKVFTQCQLTSTGEKLDIAIQGDGFFEVQRPDGTWMELGGSGMVHPNVLRNCGIDPERYTGFAFGFGLDRLALARFGVADIREVMSTDVRFLSQF